jgi:endonuclease/exonuclease/phosphatase family metal-dependent hydrolase
MAGSPGPLVLATYNIHGAVGGDGRYDLARVAGVIGEMGSDVVALQEVDSRRLGRGPGAQLADLAAATGLEPIAGPTLAEDSGDYGNALLTALPVERVDRFDLSVSGREPRGGIDAELAWCGELLRVVAVHLGLDRRERRLQARRLAERLDRGPDGPLALLGDFNAWSLGATALRRISRRLGPAPARRTFPARWPLLPLDRIWFRPRRAVAGVEAHLTAASRLASDHLPLMARVAGCDDRTS